MILVVVEADVQAQTIFEACITLVSRFVSQRVVIASSATKRSGSLESFLWSIVSYSSIFYSPQVGATTQAQPRWSTRPLPVNATFAANLPGAHAGRPTAVTRGL